MSFAEVVFNLPVNHSFTYKVPENLQIVQPGSRVYVPFGRQIITGLVVAIKEKSSLKKVKDLIDVLDEFPLIKPGLLHLTKWLAEYYMASWGQALQLAIPKGLAEFEKEIIYLVEEKPNAELSESQRHLYHLIANYPQNSKTYYRKKFGGSSFYSVLNHLKEKGLIYTKVEKQEARVGALLRYFVRIPDDFEWRKNQNPDFQKYLKTRPDLENYLLHNVTKDILVSEFLKSAKIARSTLQKMAVNRIVNIEELAVERKLQIDYNEIQQIKELTAEQHSVVNEILKYCGNDEYKSFLLHGITGSGKTLIYIEILKVIIQKGKNAIILIPEIALTPQTVSRFKKVFGEKIAVFHSKMSAGERYDAWMACYKNQIKIAIGPRSALFAPLDNLGLIVVDEEHEQSYKQTDSAPLYNARDVALFLANQHKALIVLGSATPSFESYYNAQIGKHTLLELKNRATSAILPTVFLVDMTKEKRNFEGRKVISRLLTEKIKEKLLKNEQIIILQNRRGYASYQQCLHCGFIAKCNECEVTLTFHNFDNKLRCHYCGLTVPATGNCFNCGSDKLDNKGIGTQQVYEEIKLQFPAVNILRMDQDTTRGKNAHGEILTAFKDGKAQILLGTQMISKGLDFPNVTLVGVISADIGLSMPDFRSPERVFQLLSQVAGRAGRGEKKGEVVIQTYQYSHYAIRFVKDHNYIGFYKEEIIHRETYKYPPFVRIIQLTVSSSNLTETITKTREIALPVRKHGRFIYDVIGPAPSVISKLKNLYRWQVILKINRKYDPSGTKTRAVLNKILEPYYRQKKASYFLNVDVDPVFTG
jgi:primosomal protein N' (replication factor Y)